MTTTGAGQSGEHHARTFLENSGYRILEQNFRCRQGEIDLIAEKKTKYGPTTVFVEVKSRRGHSFGTGAQAVTWHKQQKIIRTAQHYAAARKLLESPLRFDVIEIDLDGVHEPVWYEGAFGVSG